MALVQFYWFYFKKYFDAIFIIICLLLCLLFFLSFSVLSQEFATRLLMHHIKIKD
jgi:outer membrane lipoprotein-sorting protein